MTEAADATRALLEDIITRHPGVNKSALAEQAGLPWGTLYYHVGVLEREGRVRSVTTGWETLHFPPGLDERHGAWLAALRKPARQDLVRAVHGRPSSEAAELASELGLSRRMVQRHLASLGAAGVVERVGRRSARYRLSEQAQQFVGRLLG